MQQQSILVEIKKKKTQNKAWCRILAVLESTENVLERLYSIPYLEKLKCLSHKFLPLIVSLLPFVSFPLYYQNRLLLVFLAF